MYKPTRVSVEGFVNYEDKIVDVEENNNPAAASAALAGGRGASPLSVEDPYLNSVPIGKNSQGEPTLTVTLAGLKAAQELALSQIKLANLTNKDPEGELLTRIRRRGEFIVLLFQRALNTRLRDLYSQFLRRIIDDGSVYRAEIILPQDNRSKKAILNLNSSRAPERDRGEQLRQLEKELQMSLPRDSVGESQSFDPEAPEEQTDETVDRSDNINQNIRVLGVEFDNIAWPLDNDGVPISNIKLRPKERCYFYSWQHEEQERERVFSLRSSNYFGDIRSILL